MLHFLPGPVLGILSLLLLAFNTVWWCTLLLVMSFFKFAVPGENLRILISKILVWLANSWVHCNDFIFSLTQKVKWDIEGVSELSPKKWYLVIANHQSWIDIFVLQKVFTDKIPFFRFFLKQQLIWVPFLGPTWWALDYPFMKRYSREELQKKPHLKGKDLETTRIACEKFKKIPVSVMNFVEGTRLTPERRARQKSPYRHLLIPKAGGVLFTLQSMGVCFNEVLDVTILYPKANVTLWDYLCGRIPSIYVRVKSLPVPATLCAVGSAQEELQVQCRDWLNGIWTEKDRFIEGALAKMQGSLI